MFPDFLVIGGQRCGTGWLETILRRHPEIWISPRKEVHYFDRDDKRMVQSPDIINISDRRQLQKIMQMLSVIKKIAANRKDYSPSWFFRYYFLKRDKEAQTIAASEKITDSDFDKIVLQNKTEI